MKRLLYFLPFLLLLLLLGFFLPGLKHNPSLLPSALIDKPFPALSLPVLFDQNKKTNEKIHLLFQKKATLLHVFATWCDSCQAELPLLTRIQAQLKNQKKIQFYGMLYKDAPENLNSWLGDHASPYDGILLDGPGLAAIELGVYGTPETFIIDKNGVIRFKHVGPITEDVWQQVLSPALRTAAL